MAIFRRGHSYGGVECRWGRHHDEYRRIYGYRIDHCCSANNNCDGRLCSLSHRPPDISESCLSRNGQCEVQVTNNISLWSTYCTIEATDRHEASCGLSATAGLLAAPVRGGFLSEYCHKV